MLNSTLESIGFVLSENLSKNELTTLPII
jgi:hypothetical protein